MKLAKKIVDYHFRVLGNEIKLQRVEVSDV